MGADRRSCPYLGLLPFHEEDADYFFGRKREIRLIKANLFASPLTLLYGPSGVGKSSVLRAGVVPELRKRDGAAVLVFDRWQGDPAADLKQLARKVVELDPHSGDETLDAYLLRAAATRHVILILDQFEEFFLYSHARDAFAAALPRIVGASDRISVLLSLREDTLSNLDRFEGSIPALFDNYLRISHLSQEAAREAIFGPVKKYNELQGTRVRVEPELADAVLAQVRSNAVSQILEQAKGLTVRQIRSDDVETPYLQLVMTRIWDRDVPNGHQELRYETLKELGGTEQIVKRNLDEQMSLLEPAERQAAARVFHYLVTPAGSKIAYTAGELAQYANVDPATLTGVMDRLSHRDVRVLRGVPPRPGQSEPRYEIFHDVLASGVLDWRARFERERLAAERSAEATQALAEARERTARQRRLLILFGLLAIALFLAMAFAIWQSRVADAATRAAKLRAEQSAALATELQDTKDKLEIANKLAKERLQGQLQDLQRVASESPSPKVQETVVAQVAAITAPPPEKNNPPLPRGEDLTRTPPWPGLSLWKAGAKLRVSFLDGDRALQERVFEAAKEWTNYANLIFVAEYRPDKTATIRVSFKRPGSWATLGTGALKVPPGEPTVNLGFLTNETDPALLRRTVLHEFGHVLGLVHEFANPNSNLDWTNEKVLELFTGPPNYWSKEAVEFNFRKPEVADYREFDPTSVMMFAFPEEIMNAVGIKEKPGNDLSESDKAFVRKLYPRP